LFSDRKVPFAIIVPRIIHSKVVCVKTPSGSLVVVTVPVRGQVDVLLTHRLDSYLLTNIFIDELEQTLSIVFNGEPGRARDLASILRFELRDADGDFRDVDFFTARDVLLQFRCFRLVLFTPLHVRSDDPGERDDQGDDENRPWVRDLFVCHSDSVCNRARKISHRISINYITMGAWGIGLAAMGAGMALGGLLGGGQQARIERRKETTMVFDSVFEALSKAENIQQVEGVVIQNLSVGDIECYGNIEIVQDSSINMNIIQTFTEEQATTLANNIAVDLEAKAEQTSKQKAGFANFIPQSSEQLDTAITDITDKIRQQITSEFLNQQIGKLVVDQTLKVGGDEGKLVIDPTGLGAYLRVMERLGQTPDPEVVADLGEIASTTKCKFGQDSDIVYVAQQTAEKIYEIIATSDVNNKLRDDYKAYNDQESEGIGDAIGDILGAVTWLHGIVSIASSAMCVLLLVAPSMMGGGGGGGGGKSMANVGSGFNARAKSMATSLGKLK